MNNYFTLLTKIPIVALLLTGLLIFVFHFINPCWWSVFFVLLWILIATININGYIANNKYLKYVIVMVMLANGIYSIHLFFHRNDLEFGFNCIGYLDHYSYKPRSSSYDYYIQYYDQSNFLQLIKIVVPSIKKDETDLFIIYVKGNDGAIIKKAPSPFDLEKYKYPVYSISKNIEVGNDSYEYAKYSPDIAYNSFGLTIVLKATTYDSKFISFYDLNHKFQYLSKERSDKDTFLVYSNINPDFNDGWHICADSLCTPENIAKIDSAGYGYLFRGKIYSKEETEKYWNIIEQYKLRTLTSKP